MGVVTIPHKGPVLLSLRRHNDGEKVEAGE